MSVVDDFGFGDRETSPEEIDTLLGLAKDIESILARSPELRSAVIRRLGPEIKAQLRDLTQLEMQQLQEIQEAIGAEQDTLATKYALEDRVLDIRRSLDEFDHLRDVIILDQGKNGSRILEKIAPGHELFVFDDERNEVRIFERFPGVTSDELEILEDILNHTQDHPPVTFAESENLSNAA